MQKADKDLNNRLLKFQLFSSNQVTRVSDVIGGRPDIQTRLDMLL